MRKRCSNKIFHSLLYFLGAFLLFGEAGTAQIISPFNHLRVRIDTSSSYSFIVTGHLHGASTNASGYPASSLLANIDTLNSLDASFMITLGDIFMEVNDQTLTNYDRSFFSKLKLPMFNAVGNHDVSRGLYAKRFGNTFTAFIQHSEAFIILDTELDDGRIEGNQFDFFTSKLQEAMSAAQVKNIFIFSHRPVWAENDPIYSKLFTDNTQTAIGTNGFESTIRPLLIAAAKIKSVYWISGSMGGEAPASFFSDKKDNITYMATAIRDLPRDAVLKVNCSNGKISFTGISFTGQELLPIENYDLAFWQSSMKSSPPFNYRLLPYLTLLMVKHHYFWIGFLCGSLLIFIMVLIIRKRRIRQQK